MQFISPKIITVLIGIGFALMSFLQSGESLRTVLELPPLQEVQPSEQSAEPNSNTEPLFNGSIDDAEIDSAEDFFSDIEIPPIEPRTSTFEIPLESQTTDQLPDFIDEFDEGAGSGTKLEGKIKIGELGTVPRSIPQSEWAPQTIEILPFENQAEVEAETARKPLVNPAPKLGVVGASIHDWGFGVVKVLPGSIASQLGIERGDVIVALNGKTVSSASTIRIQLTRMTGGCGVGLILIDKKSGRNHEPKHRCQSSRQQNAKPRFHKIWFRL